MGVARHGSFNEEKYMLQRLDRSEVFFRSARIGLILAIILVVACSQFCAGQAFTSSITGTVTDLHRGFCSGRQVELRNMATSDTYKAVSQADGSFQFNSLIPGTYELAVTASAFKTYVQQNLALQANRRYR